MFVYFNSLDLPIKLSIYADAPTIEVGVTTEDDAGEDEEGCCDSFEEDKAAAADTASLALHEYADAVIAAAAAAAAAAELLYADEPITSCEVGELEVIIADADDVGESCCCWC